MELLCLYFLKRTGVKCGYLPSPYNGQALLGGITYKFHCLKGYVLIGDSARTCQTNGEWSGIQPRCICKWNTL